MIGVRLSVFDTCRIRPAAKSASRWPIAQLLPYQYGFGVDANESAASTISTEAARAAAAPARPPASSPVNLTCGSPYYNPHIQRPAIFPPSDGYQPPEDPLVGVARQIDAARECKAAVPDLPLVGTGYTYLQDYLPHVAQAVVRAGWVDFVGLGRMVLSYPELPADTLAGRPTGPQTDLPHLQRLHHRPAQRPRLRLLPARPVLQTTPRSQRPQTRQARPALAERTVQSWSPSPFGD